MRDFEGIFRKNIFYYLRAILKMYFLRQQFLKSIFRKCIFGGSSFENVLLKKKIKRKILNIFEGKISISAQVRC